MENSEKQCNIQLLLKPCQSGKTQECFQIIYKSFVNNGNQDLNFIICDNSLFQTIQIFSRINKSDSLKDLNSQIMSSQHKKYKEIYYDIMNEDLRNIICCNNQNQLQSINKLITILQQQFYINIYFDEADKYIDCITKFVSLWIQKVETITFITATPQNIIKHYDQIPIMPLEKTYQQDLYQSLQLQDFITTDAKENNYIKFAEQILNQQNLQIGQIWFIPAGVAVKSHNEMTELLKTFNMQVVKLNGQQKILYLQGQQLQFKSNVELNVQLDDFYHRFELKNQIVAITGNLCIGRGITLNTQQFMITHAILPNIKDQNVLYQLAGRLCGNFKQFNNFKKIQIFCSNDTKHKIINLEIKAMILPETSFRLNKEIDLKLYSEEQTIQGAIGETVYFDIFEDAKIFVKSLKSSAKILQPKNYETVVAGSKKKYTIEQFKQETQNLSPVSLLNHVDIKNNKFSYKMYTLFKDDQYNEQEVIYAIRWSSTNWICDPKYNKNDIASNYHKYQIKYDKNQIFVIVIDE